MGAARPESSLELTLAVALLKGEKFDLVVQKATELGVTRIVPVVTKLADIRLRDTSDASKRVSRWQRIALEASKQSGRAVVPVVETARSHLSRWSVKPIQVVQSCFPNATVNRWRRFSRMRPSSLTALVGSEGGWTDQEITMAREKGWRIVTLGGRTLRAETAAITVAALLQHLFGDLK